MLLQKTTASPKKPYICKKFQLYSSGKRTDITCKRHRHLRFEQHYRQISQLAFGSALYVCACTIVGLRHRYEPLFVDGIAGSDTHLRHGNGFFAFRQQKRVRCEQNLHHHPHLDRHHIADFCHRLRYVFTTDSHPARLPRTFGIYCHVGRCGVDGRLCKHSVCLSAFQRSGFAVCHTENGVCDTQHFSEHLLFDIVSENNGMASRTRGVVLQSRLRSGLCICGKHHSHNDTNIVFVAAIFC